MKVLQLPITEIPYSGIFQTNLKKDKKYSLEGKVWKGMVDKEEWEGRRNYIESSCSRLKAEGM